ncbi:AraC family transcriptional regulator ligand-binding domain-containing protein [Agrobacterium vaccinii]|uniref:AraC family transcriptional regulator n=1 Tax=Agrobacterium vaccinii TaxID=2735528 RepID=UPI001E48D8A3|nr:AraC family transcriptional regulator [Agrobacterium vaccinii]UHS61324.1 AraC family transcriptional regulator ligand-binding domain-containing protein [Agrobacterium vaccinii]
MTVKVASSSDRCRLPRPFWYGIETLGLRPSAVLSHAKLPMMLYLDESAVITTAQLFSVWEAIEALSGDHGFGLRMVEQTSTANHKLAFLTASFAVNFRDGLERIVRFKRICSPDKMLFEERDGKVSLAPDWPSGTGAEPALSVDASFAMIVELGRRGSGKHIVPVLVEYARNGEASAVHEEFYGCPVRFGADRDRLVLKSSDMEMPFAGHNPEMLSIMTPALTAALVDVETWGSVPEHIKVVLKRNLASGRPGIANAAQELGLSERTLQRRIGDAGTTFRALLDEVRQELAISLLSDASIAIDEIAFLLGYEDESSFYRSFKSWQKTSPQRWRKTRG